MGKRLPNSWRPGNKFSVRNCGKGLFLREGAFVYQRETAL